RPPGPTAPAVELVIGPGLAEAAVGDALRGVPEGDASGEQQCPSQALAPRDATEGVPYSVLQAGLSNTNVTQSTSPPARRYSPNHRSSIPRNVPSSFIACSASVMAAFSAPLRLHRAMPSGSGSMACPTSPRTTSRLS